MANREIQHCFVADGEGEISYDAQLIIVGNVCESDDGKVCVAGGELLAVRAAESDTASGRREVAKMAQTNHPFKTHNSWAAGRQ